MKLKKYDIVKVIDAERVQWPHQLTKGNSMSKYHHVDCSFEAWKMLIAEKHPTATIDGSPDESGTYHAITNGSVVGDWNDHDDPQGGILQVNPWEYWKLPSSC
jgi:hypothetical protein